MLLTEVLAREATRDQVDTKIVLRKDLADRIKADSTLRAMIYCASDPINPYTLADIAFPYQVEIKINEDEVKANIRGLKNKPGSTRPADITKLLRIRADYSNMMKVTYALTQKVSVLRLVSHLLFLCTRFNKILVKSNLVLISLFALYSLLSRNFTSLSILSGSIQLRSWLRDSSPGD